jgi:hypothetical protein
VQNRLSFNLLSKTMKIKIYKTIILPVGGGGGGGVCVCVFVCVCVCVKLRLSHW